MPILSALRRGIDRLVINDPEYRFLFRRQETDEAISLDSETTGFAPRADDLISISAIPIKGKRILTSEAFNVVVRPDAALRAESVKIHQLRLKDLEHGRHMSDVLPELLHFIGARPIVGYWIDFDIQMLNKYMLKILNIRLPNPLEDVCDLFYDRKFANAPPGTQLDLRYATIMKDLGLPDLAAHDAFNDALGAAEMYVILKDMKERGYRIPRAKDDASPFVGVG